MADLAQRDVVLSFTEKPWRFLLMKCSLNCERQIKTIINDTILKKNFNNNSCARRAANVYSWKKIVHSKEKKKKNKKRLLFDQSSAC